MIIFWDTLDFISGILGGILEGMLQMIIWGINLHAIGFHYSRFLFLYCLALEHSMYKFTLLIHLENSSIDIIWIFWLQFAFEITIVVFSLGPHLCTVWARLPNLYGLN